MGQPALELSETLIQYTAFDVFKFLTSTPNLSSRPYILPLGSNTGENLV